MKRKVLIGPSSFGSLDSAPIDFLTSNGFEVIDNPYKRKLTKTELLELLDGVDGLIAGLETIDREVLEKTKLRVISRCGSGISNVDVEACKEFGVIFKYTPYGPTQAVAELTLCMMLSLLRKAYIMHDNLSEGKWDKHVGYQLMGKTIVIVGFGRIGQRTASLLQPFNVDIIAVDNDLKVDDKPGSVRAMSLHDALPLADFVILHLSGEEQVIRSEEFRLMRSTAFFCNAARGENVDEKALEDALRNKEIAGAWLDSFAHEPYSGVLCQYSNVLLTPHVGSYTREGRLSMEMDTSRNLLEGFLE